MFHVWLLLHRVCGLLGISNMLSISLCEHHLTLFADLLHWICWAYGALGTTMRTSLTCWLHWDELLTIHTSSFMVVDKPEAQRFMVLALMYFDAFVHGPCPKRGTMGIQGKPTAFQLASPCWLRMLGVFVDFARTVFAAVSGAPVNYCNRLNQDYEWKIGWSTKRTIR